jgi:hypothetical protein
LRGEQRASASVVAAQRWSESASLSARRHARQQLGPCSLGARDARSCGSRVSVPAIATRGWRGSSSWSSKQCALHLRGSRLLRSGYASSFDARANRSVIATRRWCEPLSWSSTSARLSARLRALRPCESRLSGTRRACSGSAPALASSVATPGLGECLSSRSRWRSLPLLGASLLSARRAVGGGARLAGSRRRRSVRRRVLEVDDARGRGTRAQMHAVRPTDFYLARFALAAPSCCCVVGRVSLIAGAGLSTRLHAAVSCLTGFQRALRRTLLIGVSAR